MSYKPLTLITVSPSVVRFQDVPSSFPSTNICPLRLLTLSPCHPQARTPSPSRVPLRHRKARAISTSESHETRSTGHVERRLLHHYLQMAPLLRLSLPARLCRARRMYATCPCAHVTQLLVQAAIGGFRQRSILSYLFQRTALRPRDHGKRSNDTVCSCVRTLARRSYWNLIARTTTHLTFSLRTCFA
jgi:hypothetical protein